MKQAALAAQPVVKNNKRSITIRTKNGANAAKSDMHIPMPGP